MGKGRGRGRGREEEEREDSLFGHKWKHLRLTIADISFVCDFAQFLREGHYQEQLNGQGLSLISEAGQELYPKAFEHMLDLNSRPEFSEVMGTYLNWYRRKLSDQGE